MALSISLVEQAKALTVLLPPFPISHMLVYDDLWRYTNGTWTWLSGGVPPVAHRAVYGTKGIGTVESAIGARSNLAVWIDSLDRVWMFGGFGRTDATLGDLQDVWVWDHSIWTWVDGSTLVEAISEYAPIGISSTVVPSGRASPIVLYLNDSYVWFYGGAQTAIGSEDKYFADVLVYDTRLINFTIQMPQKNDDSPLSSSQKNGNNVVAIVVPICVVAVVAIAGIVGFLMRRKRAAKPSSAVAMETENNSLYVNLNELKNKKLVLGGIVIQSEIGQGNFGWKIACYIVYFSRKCI